jgi:hypothetical protein
LEYQLLELPSTCPHEHCLETKKNIKIKKIRKKIKLPLAPPPPKTTPTLKNK